jgi:D-alanyl-D-alanine carboxypeptidase/D-alanyl-D-alanine-endopeptidase (penicillin-binding protein 4)
MRAGGAAKGRARAADGTAKGGIRGLIARHPTAWLVTALSVAFVLLGTGAVYAGIANGSSSSAQAIIAPTDTAPPPRPQPTAVPTASHLRTCSIAGPASNPDLMALGASVINTATGEELFDRSGTTPQPTASVLKLLVAAAAIGTLGVNGQLSTRVIDGSSPGTIVLVGGGDPTLATTTNTFYTGAPQISDLANQAMVKYNALHPGVPITNIVLDSTMWDPNDNWDPSWPASERTDGYQPLITALMVDGDRADPTVSVSPRSTDPIGNAGAAFAAAAGLSGITFSRGAAVGTTVLGEVKSQPVSTLISQMLLTSDNTLGEMLARVTSKTMGLNGGSASLQQAIPGALAGLGMQGANGLTIKDGSGESPNDAVPPLFVSQLLVKIKANEKDLGVIYSGMPVGGKTGDLAGRFTGDNAIAAGNVIAKPGWIDNQRSLAGIVNAADGTSLAFTFFAVGDITYAARAALDTLTTAVYVCGNNLSNN